MDVQAGSPGPLRVILFSFGYKYGLPKDSNLLFDVRFLPNPYWVDSLRHRTGQENEVSAYAIGNETGRQFLELLEPMIIFLVNKYKLADKKELYVAVGCTGGRHRSVAVVEALRRILETQSVALTVFHRDIEKG